MGDQPLWNKFSRAHLKSYRGITVDVYLTSGHRDDAWDSQALFGLSMFARFVANEAATAGSREMYQGVKALNKALQLGCRDSMVIYAALRLEQTRSLPAAYLPKGENWAWFAPLFEEMETGSTKFSYHPLTEAKFHLRTSQGLIKNSPPIERVDRAKLLLDRSFQLLVEAAPKIARYRFHREDWHRTVIEAMQERVKLGGTDYERCLGKFVKMLE